MADRQAQRGPRPTYTNNHQVYHHRPGSRLVQKLRDLIAPNSSQLVGFLTLILTGGVLLLLTGLTVTATVVGLIFITPLVIVTSPIWFPTVIFLFLATAGFLSLCGSAVATVTGFSWLYKYFRGLHPVGADQVDYARGRIYDTASHVKNYAREYGGYLQRKVKDAAPGA